MRKGRSRRKNTSPTGGIGSSDSQPHMNGNGSAAAPIMNGMAGNGNGSMNGVNGGAGGAAGGAGEQQRRKPQQPPSGASGGDDKAALTDKNYRLAKELSDLRVRHREETRAVTRLTMENMNLATRCRQAINHVDMLKKELETLQKQTSNGTIRSNLSPTSNPFHDVENRIAMGSDQNDTQHLYHHRANSLPSFGSPSSYSSNSTPKHNTSTPTSSSNTNNNNNNNNSFTQDPTDSDVLQQLHELDLNSNGSTPTGSGSTGRKFQVISKDKAQDNFDFMDKKNPSGSTSNGNNNNIISNNKFDLPTKPQQRSSKHKRQLSNETAEKVKNENIVNEATTTETKRLDDNSNSDNGSSGGDGPDIAFGELHSNDFFHNSYKVSLPATPEKENGGDDGIGLGGPPRRSSFEDFRSSSNQPKGSLRGMALDEEKNMDAFEASFNTTFPTSFATSSDMATSSNDEVFNLNDFSSDPFFVGDEMDMKMDGYDTATTTTMSTSTTNESSKNGNGRGHSPPPPQYGMLSDRQDDVNTAFNMYNGTDELLMSDEPGVIHSNSFGDTGRDSRQNLDLFPESPMSGFDRSSSSPSARSDLSTPPSRKKANGDYVNQMDDQDYFGAAPPPPPSEKNSAGVAKARARYGAALGEKMEDVVEKDAASQSSQSSSSTTDHSPTLVLKRLQQRRAKEKANAMSSSSEMKSNGQLGSNNRKVTSDDIRKLDAMANASVREITGNTETYNTGRSRRVRQPISYEEPSLGSKLRRGDVYFPKKEMTEVNH